MKSFLYPEDTSGESTPSEFIFCSYTLITAPAVGAAANVPTGVNSHNPHV